jgi:hypothetical protein
MGHIHLIQVAWKFFYDLGQSRVMKLMSNSALLISSDDISFDDLNDFILSIGGHLLPQESSSFVISDQGADLWLAKQDEEFASDFYDASTLEEWKRHLGKDMKTVIELRLDHTILCKQLYLYVSYELGRRWNIVLDDVDDSVVSYRDIVATHKSNCDGLTINKA